MKLSSFDIFDTTLFRLVGEPDNVFFLLGKKLYPDNSKKRDSFIRWRMLASSPMMPEKDINLDDIYDAWDNSQFPEYDKEEVKEKETELERLVLYANPAIVQVIDNRRKKGDTIAFISDMYLPEDFILSLLIREKVFQKGDYLYISNKCNARKDTGTLYDVVKKDLKPSTWNHYGDNLKSDIQIARRKGISAHLVRRDYSAIVKNLIQVSAIAPDVRGLSMISGVLDSTRTIFGDTVDVTNASDYLSSLFVPYILHIRKDASIKGITRLYFLMRDGYILEKVFSSLSSPDIEARTLYVSRQSIRLAYLYKADIDAFLDIMPQRSLGGQSVEKLLSILNISDEEIRFPFAKIINQKEQNEFLNTVFSEPIYSIWQARAREAYVNTISYFEQEGVFEDHIALVDVGWAGSTRLMINKLRARKGYRNCFTYYWGITDDAISMKYGDFDYYQKNTRKNEWVTFVIENYFSACPFPTTIGYECVDDRWCPIFKKEEIKTSNIVVDTNVSVMTYVAKKINDLEISDDTLYIWMSYVYDLLKKDGVDIDYTPFLAIANDDEFVFRKFTFVDTIDYIRMRTITSNDVLCAKLTFGKVLLPIIELLRCTYAGLCTIKFRFFSGS